MMKRKTTKALYRPVGLASSLIGGVAATVVFKQVWKLASKEGENPPSALASDRSMREILLAAALQGAIFSLVKTLVDRAGAEAFHKWSGEWPES